jgi:hypothetical protein
VQAAALSPTSIAETVQQAWAASLTRQRRAPVPHDHVYASAYRVCLRRMVYEMTVPDQQPSFSADVLAKFRRGEDRERDLLADLTRAGRDAEPPFTVIGQQEHFKLKDRKQRIAVTGKVDARLAIANLRPPIEVKAWSPQMTTRIETFEDVFENPWTRSGGYQLLSYLFGAGEPFGFLLLDRSGLPALLPVELEPHLERMEDFLARAEEAKDHVEAGTLPPFLEGDSAECRRCGFYGTACNPDLSSPGITVLTDPEIEALLERREAVKAAGKEFLDLDREIKARLRGIESGVAGPFHISGSWGKQSRLDLPVHLKKQYTVTDPKGRFTLDITRL